MHVGGVGRRWQNRAKPASSTAASPHMSNTGSIKRDGVCVSFRNLQVKMQSNCSEEKALALGNGKEVRRNGPGVC